MATPVLGDAERAFFSVSRTGTMATTATDGRPRLVPICFALRDGLDDRGRAICYSPIDEKPKSTDDAHRLARVRDILVLPDVTLLVERWDEDWSRLAWLRAYGNGELLEPGRHESQEHARAIELLRTKYPQYCDHALETRPIIRIAIDRVVSWGPIEG